MLDGSKQDGNFRACTLPAGQTTTVARRDTNGARSRGTQKTWEGRGLKKTVVETLSGCRSPEKESGQRSPFWETMAEIPPEEDRKDLPKDGGDSRTKKLDGEIPSSKGDTRNS